MREWGRLAMETSTVEAVIEESGALSNRLPRFAVATCRHRPLLPKAARAARTMAGRMLGSAARLASPRGMCCTPCSPTGCWACTRHDAKARSERSPRERACVSSGLVRLRIEQRQPRAGIKALA
jgi:hypothetical protein